MIFIGPQQDAAYILRISDQIDNVNAWTHVV